MKEYPNIVEHLQFAQRGIPPEVVGLKPTIRRMYRQLEKRLGSVTVKSVTHGNDQFMIDRYTFGIQVKITSNENPDTHVKLHILPSGYGIKETWEAQEGTNTKIRKLDFVREKDKPELETALALASQSIAA